MYEVILTSSARKQLKKLETSVADRVIAALERIRIRPQDYLKRLVGELLYSLRVGDYRVLVELDHGKLVVLVIKIGHRRDVYQ